MASNPSQTNFLYSYFKESVSGGYHMYQFIPLPLRDYLRKLKQTWQQTKVIAEMKSDTEQMMKLE